MSALKKYISQNSGGPSGTSNYPKYINQSDNYSGGPSGSSFEVISLLPEQYHPKEDDPENKNYVSFSFYEHKDEVKRYINERDRKQDFKVKHICEIQMPLTNDWEIFKDSFQVDSSSTNLDFFPNLFYDTIQKHGGDITSILKVFGEGSVNRSTDDRYEMSEESLNKLSPLQKSMFENLQSIGMAREQALAILFGSLMNSAVHGGDETQNTKEGSFMKGTKYSTGVAYNPKLRFLYNLESVHPRDFRFNYRFIPKNKEEIKNIRRVEYLFQKHAAPTKWTGEDYFGEINLVNYINHFRWPKKVQVKLFIGGKEFTKFKFLPASVIDFTSSIDKKENRGDRTFITDEDELLYPNAMSFIISIRENKIFTRNDVDIVKNLN